MSPGRVACFILSCSHRPHLIIRHCRYNADALSDDGGGGGGEDGDGDEGESDETEGEDEGAAAAAAAAQPLQQQQPAASQQQQQQQPDGTAGKGHVTNYAQNVDGTVWDLDMLKQHLGERDGLTGWLDRVHARQLQERLDLDLQRADSFCYSIDEPYHFSTPPHPDDPGEAAYDKLWAQLVASAARVVAATLPDILAEQAKLKLPPHSSFEVGYYLLAQLRADK